MNHWPFVIASYTIVLLGTAVVIAYSYTAMRKAEAKVDQLRKDK